MLPGLRSSLRLEGESMRSRASAASKVLSEQWILVPWTEASTETQTHNQLADSLRNIKLLIKPSGACSTIHVVCSAQRHDTTLLFRIYAKKPKCLDLHCPFNNIPNKIKQYYQLFVTSIDTVLHTKCKYVAPPSEKPNCFSDY